MGGFTPQIDVQESSPEARVWRPHRRSIHALGALALGYLIARSCNISDGAWWFAAGQATLVIALLTRGWWCREAIFAAVMLSAIGWFGERVGRVDPMRLDVMVWGAQGPVPGFREDVIVTVQARVEGSPTERFGASGALGAIIPASPRWTFPARITSVDTASGPHLATGEAWVTASGGQPKVAVGDLVRMTGVFSAIDPPANPGEPDQRLVSRQDGRVGRISVASPELIEVREDTNTTFETAGAWIARRVGWLRNRAGDPKATPDRVSHDGPISMEGQGRALLGAMLLGTHDRALEDVDAAFRRLGLVHLVAISGFNLAVLSQAVVLLMRLAGDRGRIEMIAVWLVVGAYLLITPAEAPILRAGLTVFVFMGAEALGRRYDRLTMLGWIAVALLIWRPMDLWSMGFQLSFGIVAVLLWLGQRTHDRMFGVPLRGVVSVGTPIGEQEGVVWRWMRVGREWTTEWLKRAISSSVLAWGVATPVIACHTGLVSPTAAITGVLIIPLVVTTLLAGYVGMAVGVVWPDAGAVVWDVATSLSTALAHVVTTLDRAPGAAIQLPSISVAWSAAAVATVIAWSMVGRWKHAKLWAASACVVAWLGAEIGWSTQLHHGASLRIDTLAVGDGTCHLVRSGDEAIFWDCGSSRSGMGERTIPAAVRAVGAWHVRRAVVTHANLDHYVCLVDVADAVGLREVLVNDAFLLEAAHKPWGGAAAVVRLLRAKGVDVHAISEGHTITVGESTITILNPPPGAVFAELNDTSIVGLVTTPTADGDKRLLLSGDLGPEGIAGVRQRHPDLAADVMEIPHHGSARPASMAYVEAVNARIVLQSTGPQRVNDPRWSSVRSGRTWHTTATDGAAWVEILRDGVIRDGSFRGRD